MPHTTSLRKGGRKRSRRAPRGAITLPASGQPGASTGLPAIRPGEYGFPWGPHASLSGQYGIAPGPHATSPGPYGVLPGILRLPARFRWSVWLLKWPVWLPSWSRWPSSSRWLTMDAHPASWPAWPRSWRTRCRVGAARLPSWAGDLPICSARLCTVEPRPSPGSVLSSRFRRFFTWPGCLQWLSAQLPSWSPRHSRLGGV